MEQIEDVHLMLCHLICTVLRERLRRIEPPVSLMLDAAVWRQGGSPVEVPLSPSPWPDGDQRKPRRIGRACG
jgi:hypothetical protein